MTYVHAVLCWFGIHTPQRIDYFEDGQMVRYCGSCGKSLEVYPSGGPWR